MKYIIELKGSNCSELSFIYDSIYDAINFLGEALTHSEIDVVIEIRSVDFGCEEKKEV